MTLSLEDLFRRQRQTWASCPERVQTMILRSIRDIIKAKIQKEHGVQDDRSEGYTDDWDAVAAEVQSQISSRAPCVRLRGFRVRLPATCGSGPWRAPQITETTRRKPSRLWISARHRPPGSSAF